MIITEVLVTSDTAIFCGADGGPRVNEMYFKVLNVCVCTHVCNS